MASAESTFLRFLKIGNIVAEILIPLNVMMHSIIRPRRSCSVCRRRSGEAWSHLHNHIMQSLCPTVLMSPWFLVCAAFMIWNALPLCYRGRSD